MQISCVHWYWHFLVLFHWCILELVRSFYGMPSQPRFPTLVGLLYVGLL